jgi:hypothetical protein
VPWVARVQRAPHAPSTPVQHMGIDHGGAHIGMTQQSVYGANVVARGKGMAKGVTAQS